MKQRLDLLLVNPGASKQVYGQLGPSLSAIEPPIWCGITAAYVRDRGYSVKIIDAEAENWSPERTAEQIAKYNPLLATIVVLGSNPSASSSPKMTVVGELLKELNKKAPQIKTLLSGLHPSALPERTIREEEVDFVCQGEGFITTLNLLKFLKSGVGTEDYSIEGLWYKKDNEVVSNPPAPLVENLDTLPLVAWDLFPMEKYRAHNWHCFEHIDQRHPYAAIYTSLGCPYNCSYCNISALYNGKPGIRYRSPKKVVEEIDLLVRDYQVKNIKILDELFAINEDRVMSFCDLIIRGGYDLNMWAYARVDTVNRRMLEKMKQAGINWLCYGFESFNDMVREGVSKRTEQETINKAIEMTRAAGIYIIANFIFGLPDDDIGSIQKTLDMAMGYNFEYVNIYTAMAYPGSELYRDAVDQGIKLPNTWHGFAQLGYETLPLPTKHLTAGEVLRFRDKAFVDYFSNPAYQEMIQGKFGPEAVEHINGMLNHKIERKYS